MHCVLMHAATNRAINAVGVTGPGCTASSYNYGYIRVMWQSSFGNPQLCIIRTRPSPKSGNWYMTPDCLLENYGKWKQPAPARATERTSFADAVLYKESEWFTCSSSVFMYPRTRSLFFVFFFFKHHAYSVSHFVSIWMPWQSFLASYGWSSPVLCRWNVFRWDAGIEISFCFIREWNPVHLCALDLAFIRTWLKKMR